MSKEKRIAIRVDSKMEQFLIEESNKSDISISQYIRLLVRGKINEQKKQDK